MNDKEMIEEMAKGFNYQCKTSCYKDKCYTRCGTYKVCEMFYNAGYRKIPKDSVVLSSEGYDILIAVENERIKEARKETAKEILQIIKDEYGYIGDLERIIAKQYGVEIKE